jgi:hypothetical protein
MPENQPTPTHSNGVTSKDVPPTEVTPRAKRRSFSAQYKVRILKRPTPAPSPERSAPCCVARASTPRT